MKKIIIWGAGGHALVVAEALRSNGEEVAGFIDSVNESRAGELLIGHPVWQSLEDALTAVMSGQAEIALGFGHCAARCRLNHHLKTLGFMPKTVIHARAQISPSAVLGHGVYVGPLAVLEASCSIGEAVIVNAGSIVCHECVIADGVSVCPGATLGGRVKVGRMSWLGIGCSAIDKIVIGDKCYIGAGAVVVRDIPDGKLAYGVPARVIRTFDSEF
jgi:UDP-N-acetylbacillosamine N-acetyltransferase